MGKKLVIKGADFSANAIGKDSRNYILDTILGGINIAPSESAFGNQLQLKNRANAANAVYIPMGASVTIKGLKGSQNKPLLFDAGCYSGEEWGHDNIVTTLNGKTTNFYPFNVEGNDTYTITNDVGGYWFAFTFAAQNKADNITISNYQIEVEVEVVT